jgi:hypothetical protein
MKILLTLAFVSAIFFLQGCATLATGPMRSGQMATVVRSDGLLVLLPEAGGPGTYGTYLVPNALGRDNPSRFMYQGNPLQINFLGAEQFPKGFSSLRPEEKLLTFFMAEADYQRKNLGTRVTLVNERSYRSGGVAYRSAIMKLNVPTPRGTERFDVHIVARVAGDGILHGGWQVMNPRTISAGEAMVRRMLASFKLVRTPLDRDELARISKEAAGR